MAGKKIVKAKGAKNIVSGIANILATFNNTLVSITDMQGHVIGWSSAGRVGFKGSRKSTAYAAQQVAQDAARQAMSHGMREVEVRVKGPGSGRESAIRAFQAIGLEITTDQGRHACAAQRLPPAQEAPRLTISTLNQHLSMARYTGPRVRISRRFGIPIFGPSKYLERRNYGPGVHGPKSRRKHTDYGLGLIEKQKLRYYYGLLERQFRGVYERALKRRGVTGEQMLQILETRLDNVAYHLGFANTRAAARQLVAHGHVRVNGRKVNIPSYGLKVNDVIEVKNSNAARQLVTKNLESAGSRAVPDWLSLNKEALKGVVMRIPTREEIQPIANEQAVVAFYSR